MFHFCWAWVAVSFTVGTAFAAPSLIVVQSVRDESPAFADVLGRLWTVSLATGAGRIYDHVDVLEGVNANPLTLQRQIAKRGMKRDVDVVFLGSEFFRGVSPAPRLRMVYLAGSTDVTLLESWRTAGARLVIGHPEVNGLSSAFLLRFMRRWREGWPASDAIRDARGEAEVASRMLGRFLKRAGKAPVFGAKVLGDNIDRFGTRRGEGNPQSIGVDALALPLASGQQFEHPPFKSLGVQLVTGLLPLSRFDVSAIPSPQEFVDQVSVLSWDQLRDAFPPPSDGEDDIWIDGEALRYLLAPIRGWLGARGEPVLSRIQGMWLRKGTEELGVSVYFDDGFRVPVADESSVGTGKLYAIDVPKTVRFRLRMNDGVFRLLGLNEGVEVLGLQIKIPVIPDRVFLRYARLDLTSGDFSVEAGVLEDLIALVANGRLIASQVEGAKVDLWASVERNLALWVGPLLEFFWL